MINNLSTDMNKFTINMTDFLLKVVEYNSEVLTEIVKSFHQVFSHGGLIYTAGAGHSLSSVMESFFRAGGIPFIRPLWDPKIFPLYGARMATMAEREVGLGENLVAEKNISSVDAVIIFSNSGVNNYPLEIALASKDRGAKVIGVTSKISSDSSMLRHGKRLYQVADIFIDTLTPPGDVSWPVAEAVTAPISSMVNSLIWNNILVGLFAYDSSLPLWRSANVSGNDSYNDILFNEYKSRIPEVICDNFPE